MTINLPHDRMVAGIIMAEPAVEPPSTAVGLEFTASNIVLATQLGLLLVLRLERRRDIQLSHMR